MREWGLPLDRRARPGRDRVAASRRRGARLRQLHGRASRCRRRHGVRRQSAAVPDDPMRKWDVQSGFAPGDDVMEMRRHEDGAALACSTRRRCISSSSSTRYNAGDRPVAPEVSSTCSRPRSRRSCPTLVLAPFGLANPDHDVTHRACMLARERLGDDVSWWCYEDNGYKHIPGMLAWRVSSLFRTQIWPTPVCPPTDVERDAQAGRDRVLPDAAARARRRLGDRRQARRARPRTVLAPRPAARGLGTPRRRTDSDSVTGRPAPGTSTSIGFDAAGPQTRASPSGSLLAAVQM